LTNTSDGAAQPNELIAVEFIGSTKAVNDVSDGFAGYRVTFVMGELEVLGGGSILVFSAGCTQVHNCLLI
jgi:hypothetical protein